MTPVSSAPERLALAVRHVAFEDLGRLEPILDRHGYAVRYLEAGIDPIDADEFTGADLVVVLGGPIGVGDADRYPFLTAELAAIRSRLLARRPTLGICLGAQLMAAALGAAVAPSGASELGYGPLEMAADAGPLRSLRDVPVLHWHDDVFDLPDGAARLAASDRCPNQAFALGPTVLGLQFHLETPASDLERWLIGHAESLVTAGVEPADLRAAALRIEPALAAAAARVFDEWLEALPAEPIA